MATNVGENAVQSNILTTQDRAEDFGYFDRLPPVLKERLNNALFPFNAKIAWETFQKYGLRNTLAIIQRTEDRLAKE